MSKCQMLKYRVGGRCGGNQPTTIHEDTQGVNKDFAKLLEQRRAMDTRLIYKEPTKTLEDSIHLRECPSRQSLEGNNKENHLFSLFLVKREEPKIQIPTASQRKKDIDFVLAKET